MTLKPVIDARDVAALRRDAEKASQRSEDTVVVVDAEELLALLDLWTVCQDFVKQREVRCAESIYQTDRVAEALPEFAEAVCEVVGYHEDAQ